MGGKNGYSRDERQRRVTSVKPFSVIVDNGHSLLNRVLTIARFIKYYDYKNRHDGYFEELLDEIKILAEADGTPGFDKDMEPSQALLYTFLKQLEEITRTFNDRWRNYAGWYLKEILGVVPLLAVPDKVWLSFSKEGEQAAFLPKGTGFLLKIDDKVAYTYHLTEDMDVQNVRLANVYSLYWERNKNILPAAYLDFITSVRVKDLRNNSVRRELMFGNDRDPQYAKALGLVISSPSLLLREGKRCVTITFRSENDKWIENIKRIIGELQIKIPGWSYEKMLFEFFNKVFYLTVSVQGGWVEIDEYIVQMRDEGLVLKFILPEDFPQLAPCTEDSHHFTFPFPALRVYPNFDAWLYPYSWLKDFLLDKIIIETSVENVSNILLYNELGQIDNSKPFTPFGLNTERGTWFVVGNYEMSQKQIKRIDLQIKWQQLPTGEEGLFSYYKDYGQELDNCSFRLRAKYLSDYDWYDTSNNKLFCLFSTAKKGTDGNTMPRSRLSDESRLTDIRIERMFPSIIHESEYEYSIKSRTGFIRLMLEEPEIGLGEKYYRQLFTDRMVKKVFQKKESEMLNPPLNPVVDKVTLDYQSQDVIDLRRRKVEGTEVLQLYPFGYKSVFSGSESRAMPFLYNLDTDANILFSFTNITGGEVITLFLEFYPVSKECTKQNIPQIVWYWGNGYHWQEASPNTILQDDTQNMITSGQIKIHVPVNVDKSLYDDNGLLWLRAGVKSDEGNIPQLLSSHINAGQLMLDRNKEIVEVDKSNGVKYEIVAEEKLPGVVFKQITPFYDGKDSENDIDMHIRISEYITHRGKAVSARDYEYLVLQVFPGVGRVKCLPGFDCKSNRRSIVSLVVIPSGKDCSAGRYKPLVSSYLMLRIEEFLAKYTSPYVRHIDVVNPVYEELFVRCDITFHENYSVALCKTRLNKLFDRTIAPWQEKQELPGFGYTIYTEKLYADIREYDFVKGINHLSVIRISNDNEFYTLYEYGKNDTDISPAQPHIIFVPAKEHIIESGTLSEFGINEMSIDETFIIGS